MIYYCLYRNCFKWGAVNFMGSLFCGVLGDLSHYTIFNPSSSVEILVLIKFKVSGQLELNISSALEILYRKYFYFVLIDIRHSSIVSPKHTRVSVLCSLVSYFLYCSFFSALWPIRYMLLSRYPEKLVIAEDLKYYY